MAQLRKVPVSLSPGSTAWSGSVWCDILAQQKLSYGLTTLRDAICRKTDSKRNYDTSDYPVHDWRQQDGKHRPENHGVVAY